MFNKIDLRALSERSGPERAFLSLYLSGPDSMKALDSRIRRVRQLLDDNPVEREYFEENLKMIERRFEEKPHKEGALCLFTCWATDYLQAFRLEQSVSDLLWVDSSPYIRPLAELQDEYENFVVVAADNSATRIYFVTSSVADEDTRVKGDVKNHVKVGGWSQKRYERRRDKELLHYAKDIRAALEDLNKRETFQRVVLVGSPETMEEIKSVLSEEITAKLAGERNANLHDESEMWEGAFDLFFQEERSEEENLWERIKGEYLRGGRAVVGPDEVLSNAAIGRVERMIVVRDARIPGSRCRECENLTAGQPERCPICGSDSIFSEDLVNELVELSTQTSADVEFSDPIPGLVEMGSIAALLRY